MTDAEAAVSDLCKKAAVHIKEGKFEEAKKLYEKARELLPQALRP